MGCAPPGKGIALSGNSRKYFAEGRPGRDLHDASRFFRTVVFSRLRNDRSTVTRRLDDLATLKERYPSQDYENGTKSARKARVAALNGKRRRDEFAPSLGEFHLQMICDHALYFLQTLAKPLLCAERTGGLVMNSAAMRISTLTALFVAVSASEGRCEIPGYPSPPGGVENLEFSWCPANVEFQMRAFALQAAPGRGRRGRGSCCDRAAVRGARRSGSGERRRRL